MAEAPNVIERPAARASTIRMCLSSKRDGTPCQAAAMRGDTLCRFHSERVKRSKAELQADGIKLLPLSELVALDVTAPGVLKRFRRGVMAHVARETLSPLQAKSLLDTALSIYESEHKSDGKTQFAALAGRIADRLKRHE